jgi:hypothetical protein
MTGRTRRQNARNRERLLGNLPDLGQVLRGSLVTRYRRCGKAGCHCARENDPGHGPAHYLMVTVPPGRTVTIYVAEKDREQVEAYLENFRRVRETLEEISTLNRSMLKEGTLFPGG